MKQDDLISYLDPSLFIPDLKARGKTDAIRKMVAHLVAAGRIGNERIVLETLKARERLGSTGIGKGVAIPHTRSTVTKHLTLLFARSARGVPFDAMDGQPVHLLFMILAPHIDKDSRYLPLLGKIVEVTRHAPVRRRLLKADGFDAVTEVFAGALK